MNHRERVLRALRHSEPDRVPLDLGGTLDSTILYQPYLALRQELGLGTKTIRVADATSQTVLVDEDVRQALAIDTRAVVYEPAEWRKEVLADGTVLEMPAKFRPRILDDGSQAVFDAAGNVTLRMPKDGFYFDSVYAPLSESTDVLDIAKQAAAIESYDRPGYLDKSLELLAEQAKRLYQDTDYVLIGFFGGHIFQSSWSIRGFQNFLVDLVANPKYAEALMDRHLEAQMAQFERYAQTVGKWVQVIHVEEDLGMQYGPIISPELYRKMIKPRHEKLYRFIKSKCDAFLLLHCDGAIVPLIPDLIEAGIDILNPVQVSARGMDTKTLKREFGRELAFWGGGCDTQWVLPFGTPDQVRDEVKRRIDDLAPGGGFVFTQVHNIQPGVPARNIAVMLETALEYGQYR